MSGIDYYSMDAEPDETGIRPHGEQIKGDDPRLVSFWIEAALIANRTKQCEVYDKIAKELGGPTRAELGLSPEETYYWSDRDISDYDPDGNQRFKQKVVFTGDFEVFGETITVSWNPSIKTSGTRADINYYLAERYGKAPAVTIREQLAKVRNRKIRALLALQDQKELVGA